MKKTLWILLMMLVIGCGPMVVDVSNEYKNRGVFGRQFLTQVNLILAQHKDSNLPSLTDNLGTLKIEEIKNEPFDYYDNRVFGVLSRGSLIEIVGALRSTSSAMGEDYFKVKIISEGPFLNREVSARYLKPLGTNEIFESKYAVEVSSIARQKSGS